MLVVDCVKSVIKPTPRITKNSRNLGGRIYFVAMEVIRLCPVGGQF